MNWYDGEDDVAAFFTKRPPTQQYPPSSQTERISKPKTTTKKTTIPSKDQGSSDRTKPRETIEIREGSDDEDSLPILRLDQSSDEDDGNDLTASQIDRHSLLNLLKTVGPSNNRESDREGIDDLGNKDFQNDEEDQNDRVYLNKTNGDPEPVIKDARVDDFGSENKNQGEDTINLNLTRRSPTPAPIHPQSVPGMNETLSDDLEDEDKRSNRPEKAERKTWSIPPRPRDRNLKSSTSSTSLPPNKTLVSPPRTSTPSKRTTTGSSSRPLDSSVSSNKRSGSDSPLLPSPLPSWERPEAFMNLSPPPLSQRSIIKKDLKGKGRASPIETCIEKDEALRAELDDFDYDRVLVPDSNDTPPRTSRRFETRKDDRKDDLYPSVRDLGLLDFLGKEDSSRREGDDSGEWQDTSGFLLTGLEDMDDGVPLNDRSDLSRKKKKKNKKTNETELEKQRRLIEELGFEEEEKKEKIPSSSPIEILSNNNPTTKYDCNRQGKRCDRKDGHGQNGYELDIDDCVFERGEFSGILDHEGCDGGDEGREQSEFDQLKEIGIVVSDSPSSGIAPLMNTWPKLKRDIFLKMAGVIQRKPTNKSKMNEEESESIEESKAQIEAWDKLLVKQQRRSNVLTNKKAWNGGSRGSSSWKFRGGNRRRRVTGTSSSSNGGGGGRINKGFSKVVIVNGNRRRN